MLLNSLLPPTVRVGTCFNNRSEQTPLKCWYLHMNLHCIIFQNIWIFISTIWENQMLHTCKYPHVHDYTLSETRNYQAFNLVPLLLCPDITYHLFREAANIPDSEIIRSLRYHMNAAADMNANKQPVSTCWTCSMILFPLHPRDRTGAELSSIIHYKTVLTLT
jgi:hypothetical protein